jgi:RecB family endonuclease NucS
MEIKKVDLIDGVAQSVISDTFEVPSPERIAMIQPGHTIKIGIKQNKKPKEFSAERCWATVKKIEGNSYICSIDNDLVMTSLHGIKYEDLVKVKKHNILAIYEF